MKELLLVNYNIYATEHIRINGREGFRDHHHSYFTISSTNKEMVLLEQAALAYYLSENGYNHTAIPIPTTNNTWFAEKDGQNYFVLRVTSTQNSLPESHGGELAKFHNLTSAYSYEPKEISSYGLWKELWTRKLTAFEHKIQQEKQEYPGEYYRLLDDVLPYIIGVSENAIQYMQESEVDRRFHQADQGVFTFRRYQANLMEPVIWTDDLVYDHPTRDIAEYIRYLLIDDAQSKREEAIRFLAEYQKVRPLSIFSWRLLYARLIFPIHLYDFMEDSFQRKDYEADYYELQRLVNAQATYEKQLQAFMKELQIDFQRYEIPTIAWLSE